MNFTFEITGVEETSAKLLGLSDRIRKEVTDEMGFIIAGLTQYVVQNKLNGQVLNVRSGRLQNAVSGSVTEGSDGSIVGRTYVAGVPYAGIQEYGGQTGPHDILPSAAKALAFMAGGEQRFAKVVHHPGSNMPERSYLRSSLFDLHDQILQDLSDAVIRSVA